MRGNIKHLSYPNQFLDSVGRTYLFKEMMRALAWKGHNSYFIYGKKGSGKSTYALLNAYAIYQDWEKALKYCCFLREEILNVIEPCFDFEKNEVIERIPLLIWDDATFENMKTKQYDAFIDEFSRFYTVIRSVVANFIWTAPSFNSLPTKLRDLDWSIIRVTRKRDAATAHFYSWNKSPVGHFFQCKVTGSQQKVKENFRFNWIPNEVRKDYEKKRDTYAVTGFLRTKEAHELRDARRIAERYIDKALKKKLEEKPK